MVPETRALSLSEVGVRGGSRYRTPWGRTWERRRIGSIGLLREVGWYRESHSPQYWGEFFCLYSTVSERGETSYRLLYLMEWRNYFGQTDFLHHDAHLLPERQTAYRACLHDCGGGRIG